MLNWVKTHISTICLDLVCKLWHYTYTAPTLFSHTSGYDCVTDDNWQMSGCNDTLKGKHYHLNDRSLVCSIFQTFTILLNQRPVVLRRASLSLHLTFWTNCLLDEMWRVALVRSSSWRDRSWYISMPGPQGSSVSAKLTKQLDVTGRVIKLHFVGSVSPPPPFLSLSTSKLDHCSI